MDARARAGTAAVERQRGPCAASTTGLGVTLKGVWRLYRLEDLQLLLSVRRRKHASLHRDIPCAASEAHERWSGDSAHDALLDEAFPCGHRRRSVESRESDPGRGSSNIGLGVAEALDRAIARHGRPCSLTVDHGTEFTSRTIDDWALRSGVLLEFIRPGKFVEGCFVESFKGKLRNECLNASQFLSIQDGRRKTEAWRLDCNLYRPHSGLGNTSQADWMRRLRNEDQEAQIVSI